MGSKTQRAIESILQKIKLGSIAQRAHSNFVKANLN